MDKPELIDMHVHCLTKSQEEALLRRKSGSRLYKYVINAEEVLIVEDDRLSHTERALLSQLKSAKPGDIEKALVLAVDSPVIDYPSERVLRLARDYRDYIIGSISVDPSRPDSPKLIERQLDKLMQVSEYRPVAKIYQTYVFFPGRVSQRYWDAIKDANGIVVFHTGPTHGAHIDKSPAINPSNWKEVIKKHPGITFVGAHCGTPSSIFESYEDEVIKLAMKNHNFYFDLGGLLYTDPISGKDFFEISMPAFDKTRKKLNRATEYDSGMVLADKCVGGTDYPVVPNIQESRKNQIESLGGFDPFRNTYLVLRK